MKKLLLTLMIAGLAVAVNAFDSKMVVINDGKQITVYKITDFGLNYYGQKDLRFQTSVLRNPTLSDLRLTEVPECAWHMCAQPGGLYVSDLEDLSGENKELKDKILEQESRIQELSRHQKPLIIGVVVLFLLFVGALSAALSGKIRQAIKEGFVPK